jgi:hypothetical protein
VTEQQSYPFSTDATRLPEWTRRITIVEAVANLSREKERLIQAYTRTILRVQKETGALKVCEDFGMMDDLYYGFDGLVGNTVVAWNDRNAQSDGQYSPIDDKISTYLTPPSREAILIELAGRGKFPFTVDMVAHELTHKGQFPPEVFKKLVMVIMQNPGVGLNYFPGMELMETISYRLTTLEPHEATPATLKEHILSSSNRDGGAAYEGFDPEKIDASIREVDNLLALGINSRVLCSLAYRYEGWNETTKTYPHLEREVQKLVTGRGLELEDLPNLRWAYVARRLEDTKKAQEIAQAELISAIVG